MSTILNKKYRYLRHYASLFMFAFTFWLSIFCVKNNDVFGSNKLNPIGTDPDPQQVLQCNQWWSSKVEENTLFNLLRLKGLLRPKKLGSAILVRTKNISSKI